MLKISEFLNFLAKIKTENSRIFKNSDRTPIWIVCLVRSLADRTFQLRPEHVAALPHLPREGRQNLPDLWRIAHAVKAVERVADALGLHLLVAVLHLRDQRRQEAEDIRRVAEALEPVERVADLS